MDSELVPTNVPHPPKCHARLAVSTSIMRNCIEYSEISAPEYSYTFFQAAAAKNLFTIAFCDHF